MEVPLRGIIFSEFHPTAGPKISYMAPENFMEKEVFDTVSSYIIPKPELKDRLITITTRDYKILGCPVCIQDKKYERNALIFNLCFVCTAQSKTKHLEPVVKKLADYLTTLETESDFVSNEATKSSIQDLITKILNDLNSTKRCSICVNDSVTIYLKVVDRLPLGDTDSVTPVNGGTSALSSPSLVREHDVPIFKPSFASLSGGAGCLEGFLKLQGHLDMTTQQILPFIDGFRHVKRVSFEADVDINLVKICLQNLLQFGYILIIPIFLYSNVYVASEHLDRLAKDGDLWNECRLFLRKPDLFGGKTSLGGEGAKTTNAGPGVTLGGVAEPSKTTTGRERRLTKSSLLRRGEVLPSFSDVFSVFCAMNIGMRLKDLCNRYSSTFTHIDVKRLIQFGLIHGLIRCVRKYPCLHNVSGGSAPADNLSKRLRPLASGRWLNGDHSLVEIACRNGIDFQELEELIEEDPCIVVCMR